MTRVFHSFLVFYKLNNYPTDKLIMKVIVASCSHIQTPSFASHEPEAWWRAEVIFSSTTLVHKKVVHFLSDAFPFFQFVIQVLVKSIYDTEQLNESDLYEKGYA